jgi:sugar O-acyltransferase (sialic acid O-acetyltransferase NeuD family)
MDELIIIGAGASSQQIACAVLDINRCKPQWSLLGFLDDDPMLQGRAIGGVPVLGPIDAAARYSGRSFIIGVANAKDPTVRRRIFERARLDRNRFATLLHPSANVSPRATIGVGTALLQNVVITQNTQVGDHVIVLHNTSIGHDVVIEDFVTIASGAVVTGWVRLRAGCYVGAGAAINNGRVVNGGATVGLGSVVVHDVAEGATVVGNPAHPIRCDGSLLQALA